MEHQFCPYCMSPVEEGRPCGACGLTEGSYTPSPHHLPPGTVLRDRYLVGRVLGEGGFGITYIGCDLQLELKVAIKEYFPTDKASRVSQASLDVSSYAGVAGVNYDKGLKRFLQEARTIARMDKQPVIVNVRDFFEINHTAYIVMEYVEGTTFKDLVAQRGGRIPAGELLYLMEPLFFALKAMHNNGLIHRDISPENLMLEKGEVRLLDFGCAREAMGGDNTLTVALKHGYAPVEQYQSKGQGPWTDVYALSATIYYCLTGRKPPQAVDRLGEDGLVPPRKLGVDLTQKQEKALLRGLAVPPTRRFQSMEEFHTALYEGFVPDTAGADSAARGPETPDAAETVTTTTAASAAERTGEAGSVPRRGTGFDSAVWLRLRRNKLLAAGAAAALALVILLAAVLPRVTGPARPQEHPPASDALAPAQLPEQSGNSADYEAGLRQAEELMTWLRQNDVEADPAEIQAKLDALPIDQIFADAVHVTTLEALDAALEGERPIVIDADIDFSQADEVRNARVPVLIVGGVTVTSSWGDDDAYGDDLTGPGYWTVDGSIFINRGTLRGRIDLGDWDRDGQEDASLLINFGTLCGDVGAGYDENHDSVVVNLGQMGISRTQFRRTSFYNLGTLFHGTVAPEGETVAAVSPERGDYFIDLIGCFFYNGGEMVLEGREQSCPSRIDAAGGTRFANHGTIRLGAWGQLNNSAAVLNFGEITAAEQTAEIRNLGWLWNTGAGCAMDASRCYNVGLVQAGPETPVDLDGLHSEDGGGVLPFGWYAGMEENPSFRQVSDRETFRRALEDRDCAWIFLSDGAALTLTEDLVLTKGLAVPDGASVTMDGASLTVAGESGYLACDGALDLRGGVFTVRDGAAASVGALTDCGGVTLRNEGYLLTRASLTLDEGAEIQLSNVSYLTSVGPLELRGIRVTIGEAGGVLRGTGGVNLYGCAVDIGTYGEFLADGGGCFDPDTEITSRGGMALNGWGNLEMASRMTSYGHLETNTEMILSGSLINQGHWRIWGGGDHLLKVSGSLENHGTVEIDNGGKLQLWAAGSITGVPKELIAD
nr:serine/threonine-protein kinase [uncultured Oscillibacter sp.]